MRILCCVLSLLSFSITTAQAKGQEDTVTIRVEYESHIRRYEEDSLQIAYQTLDIGDRTSKFYNRRYEKNLEIQDSMRDSNASGKEGIEERGKNNLPGISVSYAVYKNYPHKDELTLTDYIAVHYRYTEPMNGISWTLENGDSVVCGYRCGKASAVLRGRKWTVWYTLDIPVSDGPWKLHGLPGLILKADEQKGDFSFEAISITKPHGRIVFNERKYQKCTPKQLQEEKEKFEASKLDYLFKMANVQKPKDLKIKLADPKKPCLMEYYR